MGLFGIFGKKKSDSPVVEFLDKNSPSLNFGSDLPSIDGQSLQLPPLDTGTRGNNPTVSGASLYGIDSQGLELSPQSVSKSTILPTLVPPTSQPESLTLDVPKLDFSMPAQEGITQKPDADKDFPELSPEELNDLFISDGWKEPDWKNFDPYNEDKIESPGQADFAPVQQSDLPSFEDNTLLSVGANISVKRQGPKPLELYIRGKAYNKVFSELDSMNKSLSTQESQADSYAELLRREETILASAREQTEFLYKKLNVIDRKLFA